MPAGNNPFSVTVRANDLDVLHALRGLAEWAEGSQLKHTAWGGTGQDAWQRSDKSVIFHFSKPLYRDKFMKAAMRILPKNSWNVVRQNDNDPATPGAAKTKSLPDF